jgi:hypothetical protein
VSELDPVREIADAIGARELERAVALLVHLARRDPQLAGEVMQAIDLATALSHRRSQFGHSV